MDGRRMHHRKCENAKIWMKRNRSCVLQFPVVLIILQVLVTTISVHLIQEFDHGGVTAKK